MIIGNPSRMVLALGLVTALLANAWPAEGASAASKNREGNRLFQQGNYADAEKAYLEAQAESPGRAELLYNLGNSLIKQRKYEAALQSLRQAISKGDRGLQTSSWYNAGNALFEMGNYSDAAQHYVQALRLNPSDRDAKKNLELALQKSKQQQQAAASKDQEKKNQDQQKDQSSQEQPSIPREAEQKPGQQGPQPESPQQQDRSKPAEPKSTQADRREAFSKERALQILDALQNQELAEQRKLLERMARRKATGKDW